MTVPFNHIPSNLRVPLFYAELDPSRANTAVQAQRTLIIGQKTSAGTATANVPVRSQSVAEARTAGGAGSMLAILTYAYRQNDPAGEVWYLPLSDDGSAVAAAGSLSFTGPTTAAGTLALYIAGERLAVTLASATSATAAATAIAAAINGAANLPVTAAIDGTHAYQVNLTAKNAGLAAGDIDLRINYLGSAGGESTPAGLGVTIVAMTGGAGNPVLTTGLAALQDMPFDFIVLPYTDATSLAAMKAFLDDTAGRWSWTNQIFGHAFAAYRGTSGALTTFGVTQNDPHMTMIGIYDVPTPVWRVAADFAAAAAVSLREDPGLPLQTVAVADMRAPPIASRFGLTIRNTLLYSGISTYTADSAGGVAIENLITTYQLNSQSQPDNSYLEIETLFLLAFVLRRLRSTVSTKFGRKKLAADGRRLLPGSNVVTPSTIRAELIASYRQLEDEGYVQQSDIFAANLIVEKDPATPGRVNVLWPAILIEQLRVFAVLAQFRLN